MGIIKIISLFILAPSLIVGLFIFLAAKRKSRVTKRLQKAVDRITRKNDLIIEQWDYFRDKVIGIDEIKKKLVFAHFKNGLVDQLCVDLKVIASCILSKKIDQKLKRVTHVFLQLHLKHQHEVLRLDFYDKSNDSHRTNINLLEKARYWKDQINFNRRLKSTEAQVEYVL